MKNGCLVSKKMDFLPAWTGGEKRHLVTTWNLNGFSKQKKQ